MPYVTRDREGRVIALHANRNGAAEEELAADDPDLLSFVGSHIRLADIQSDLEASDLQLIRVIEDLISVLIDNGILKMTDLPAAAQTKLVLRGKLRAQLDGLCDTADEREEIDYGASTSLSYQVRNDIQATVSYNLTLTKVNNAPDDLMENSVLIGLTKSF